MSGVRFWDRILETFCRFSHKSRDKQGFFSNLLRLKITFFLPLSKKLFWLGWGILNNPAFAISPSCQLFAFSQPLPMSGAQSRVFLYTLERLSRICCHLLLFSELSPTHLSAKGSVGCLRILHTFKSKWQRSALSLSLSLSLSFSFSFSFSYSFSLFFFLSFSLFSLSFSFSFSFSLSLSLSFSLSLSLSLLLLAGRKKAVRWQHRWSSD